MLSTMDLGMQALLMLGATALAVAYVRAAHALPMPTEAPPAPPEDPIAEAPFLDEPEPESVAEPESLAPRAALSAIEQQIADQEATFLMTDQAELQALILETEAKRRERFGGPVQVDDEPLEQPE